MSLKAHSFTVSAALLSIAILSAPAVGQQRLPRDSASTPSLTGPGGGGGAPAPAARSQPLPSTIHNTSVSLPQMSGYCAFDESQSYDKEFSDGFRQNLASELRLVIYTQECAGLDRGRTGTLPALDSIAYMTTASATGGWRNGTRRDAATFTCNNMRNATGGERLRGTSPSERSRQAQELVNQRPKSTSFVLLQEPTACYSFSYNNVPTDVFPEFMQIQIFTRIRNHLVITNVVHTTREPNDRLPTVEQLLQRAQGVKAELERLNNER
jgi:hypothetical protein